MSRLKFFSLLTIFSFFLFACSSDDEGRSIVEPSNTIANFVETNVD